MYINKYSPFSHLSCLSPFTNPHDLPLIYLPLPMPLMTFFWGGGECQPSKIKLQSKRVELYELPNVFVKKCTLYDFFSRPVLLFVNVLLWINCPVHQRAESRNNVNRNKKRQTMSANCINLAAAFNFIGNTFSTRVVYRVLLYYRLAIC